MRGRGPVAVLVLAAACAQPQAPPGGEQDRTPPAIVSIQPEPLSIRDGAFEGPVRILFAERISERLDGVRALDEAVLVSPMPNPVKVHRRRTGIDIEMVGGWPAGHVYRVFVRGVLADLFGNVRREPIEVVFSTGPPLLNTVVGGVVTDRITGEVVDGAHVAATRRGDGTTYLAVSDTGGFFALRYIAAGAYDVVAFQDRNRNREAEFSEPVDTTLAGVAVEDTAIVTLALLPGDSTPARLLKAEPRDSTAVVLSFDDYVDPVAPVAGRARLFAMPDSTLVGGGELVHVHVFDARLAAADSVARAVAADSVARAALADTLLTDSAAAQPADRVLMVPDTVPGEMGMASDSAVADTVPEEPLPTRSVVLIPDSALVPEWTYLVELEGLVNIRGVEGGGGAVPFRAPARDTVPTPPDTAAAPAPDTAAADTVQVDTVQADVIPADTVPADTVPADTVPADTVPADTVPGDTVPRDTIPPPGSLLRETSQPPWWLGPPGAP